MRSRAGIASTLLIGAAVWSCSSGPPKPPMPTPFVETSAATTAAIEAPATGISNGLGGIPADRHPLGLTKLVSLDVSLHSIPGSNRVLAVSDFAEQPAMFAQVVGEEGLVGPVVTIAGAHFVAAFELSPEAFTIVSSERGKLCTRVLEKAKLSQPTCFDADADAIVALGGRLLLLGSRTPLPEEEEAPPVKGKPVKPKQPKPKPPPPPPKKTRAKPKPISQAEAKKKLFESGKQVELLATFVGADGALEETFGTGLEYREAMAGMSLIGAGARNERVDVLFYEHAEKKGKEPRAKLGIAQLDKDGKLDEPTKKSWGEGRLEAGFIADHADMRLLTLREGSIALGNRGPRGKCDVTVTAPFVMQMIPVQSDCAIDPRRFMVEANARRKGATPDLEEPSTIEAAKAFRTFGQPAWDVGRSVYSSTRAWAMEEDRLFYWGGTLKAIEVARPLQVERNRIHWGTFARDGSGTAETDEGLVFVAASGTLSKRTGAELGRLQGPNRSDVANAGRRAAARVGASTFQARGELRKLAPELAPKAMRRLPADTAVLVGGDEKGLLLEVSPPVLSVASLSADGKLTALGRTKALVGPGFDAVERAAGGAIVVGPAPGAGGFVSFVVHPNGGVAAARPVAIGPTPFVRMVPMPAGGAIVYDSERTVAVWLDDDGKEVGRAALPAEAETSACLDGRPAPAMVPSLVPGQLIELVSQKTPGTCIVGEIGYRPDGTMLWFGSTSSGPHVRADIGVIAAAVKVSAAVRPGTTAAPPSAPDVPAARCPSDMVFVPPDLCVDRFESTLVDMTSGRFLSSDYPATPNLIASVLGDFSTKRERMGDIYARSLPLPHLSSWQRTGTLSAAAHNQAGVRPNGYVTGVQAKSACEAAEKRLCKLDEWKKACRGEGDTIFPYGTTYAKPACNVNGQSHPGAMLHDNASILHLDPRLNRVTEKGAAPTASLLQATGRSPQCKSRWGDDAIYDMVGNIDEWVDEKSGAFAGGFYGRNTTNGCESLISVHPAGYSDYSTGIRCCRAAD